MTAVITNPMAVYENTTALRQVFEYLPEMDYIFELITNFIGIFPLSLSIYFFKKLKLFHVNLTSLLINMMTSYLIRTVFRIPVVTYNMFVSVEYYQEKHIIIQHIDTICAICQYVCGVDLCLIFLERLYATNKASAYESQTHNRMTIVAILFLWFLVTVLLYLSSYGYINILVLVLSSVMLLTISGIGMIYLLSLNHKLYRNKVNTQTNLSYRYQVAENIRSFQMLLPMLGLLLLGCIFGVIFYSTMLYIESPLIRALNGLVFTAMVACGSIILPIFAFFCHRTLRHSFFKAIKLKVRPLQRSDITRSSVTAYNIPMTLNGQKLIVGTNECTDVYFQQIQKMWN
ncbi:hypothetical protein FO519_001729 [Halicephalobus sp. NKZ332]|nr:hypothetical protein FO519_001729 [Halicephalobus sp. NKZ332]